MTDTVVDTPSALELSDEDFLKMPAPTGEVVPEATPPVEPAPAEPEAADPVDPPADPVDPVDPPVEDAPAEAVPGEGKDTVAAPSEAKGAAGVAAAAEPAAKKEVTEPPPKVEAPAIDYEAEYKRLTAPFKANGKEVAVKSAEDAIALMQMGANYNKKMAALKPNLKLLKMLENNGLLSEEKIGFLIDLEKKNPAAINKLVADSKLDPMDLDAKKAGEYKQTTYAVDDREIELDTVLDELQGSDAYTRTLEIVSNKWDGASKQVIAQQPQLLKVINAHVEQGIYDLISTEMERERMLGRLNGLSDLEAYRQVGDAINAKGGFDHLTNSKSAAEKTVPAPAAVVAPPKPKVDDSKLNDKRRAASSTKPAAPGPAVAEFNPLNMSDEEFAKVATPKFS